MKYKPMCGDTLDTTCSHVTRMAKKLGKVVRFDFNGVKLFGAPKKSESTLIWEWENAIGRNASNYHCSREGRAYEQERSNEIIKKQDSITALVGQLNGLLALNNMDFTMGWIASFTRDADDIGVDINKACKVNGGGFELLALMFEAHGFKDNDSVGNAPEWYNTRERMGRFIIGQCINCFRNNMPPHPVCEIFVEKYFKLI